MLKVPLPFLSFFLQAKLLAGISVKHEVDEPEEVVLIVAVFGTSRSLRSKNMFQYIKKIIIGKPLKNVR